MSEVKVRVLRVLDRWDQVNLRSRAAPWPGLGAHLLGLEGGPAYDREARLIDHGSISWLRWSVPLDV